jgi:predicted protein tyrosine phosphatase
MTPNEAQMRDSEPSPSGQPTNSLGRAKDGAVHVCPLSALPDIVVRHQASHLLTCLQDAVLVETPNPVSPDRHLRLPIHDISETLPGYIAPDAQHVARLIDFALGWGGRGPMVVHCWAGISRSTAAAFAALCAVNPGVDEELIALRLREASPTAYPNRLMIRLADAALARRGRMVRAIEGIGRGVVAVEALPFSLHADHSDAKGLA